MHQVLVRAVPVMRAADRQRLEVLTGQSCEIGERVTWNFLLHGAKLKGWNDSDRRTVEMIDLNDP